MFLTPNTKIWIILGAMFSVVFMMFCTPFLITAGTEFFSRELVQTMFLATEFFAVIFILNELKRLQKSIEEKGISLNILQKKEINEETTSCCKKYSAGMKGIILSGGTATRLFPLTATTSKQLLPIYDRQMIFFPLNTLIKAGIKDILVIVSPEHSGQFLNLLGSIFKNHGVNIFFEVQKTPRGLADAFIVGEKFINNENVAMVLGDNIFEDDLSEKIKNFKSGAAVFAKKVSDPERFGVVKFDENGKAVQVVEKPKEFISDYAITGLYVYDKRVIDIAKNLAPSERGEIEITDINKKYLEMGELTVEKIEGEWLDAGTFDSLLDASRAVKEKEIYKKFDPLINNAIEEFNIELKEIAKKKLL